MRLAHRDNSIALKDALLPDDRERRGEICGSPVVDEVAVCRLGNKRNESRDEGCWIRRGSLQIVQEGRKPSGGTVLHTETGSCHMYIRMTREASLDSLSPSNAWSSLLMRPDNLMGAHETSALALPMVPAGP